MSPEMVNLMISLLPHLFWIMRPLSLQRRSPTPNSFLFLLPFYSQIGCPLIVVAKLRNIHRGGALTAVAMLRNVCCMFPTHILSCLPLPWRKFQNGSESLWRRFIPPFYKRTSPFITQVLSLICISVILHHLQAMTPCTMTRLINLLHNLATHILLILKLLAQVVVMCKAVSLYVRRRRKVKTQSIPLLCFKMVHIKTLSFHSRSTLISLILAKHHAQLILSINLQSWDVITPMFLYVLMNTQAHHVICCSLMYTLTQIWNVHQ